ncbi:MAG: hypothetical protein AAFX06_31840 [Planctomycetota bacterium]
MGRTRNDDHHVLNADRLIKTIDLLSKRIYERFPESGLFHVCRRLHEIASHASHRSSQIRRPLWSVRFFALLAVTLILVASVVPLAMLDYEAELKAESFVQVLDSGINVILIIGAAILFLFTLESRIKRRRALSAIHELRSIAHIIDMHQLTKDPERLRASRKKTASSPELKMTPFELGRYLDYCSEGLSLTAKLATLYVQHFDDAVAVASSNEIEQLTTGLSRKIWQKIVILKDTDFDQEEPEPATKVASDRAALYESPQQLEGDQKG